MRCVCVSEKRELSRAKLVEQTEGEGEGEGESSTNRIIGNRPFWLLLLVRDEVRLSFHQF